MQREEHSRQCNEVEGECCRKRDHGPCVGVPRSLSQVKGLHVLVSHVRVATEKPCAATKRSDSASVRRVGLDEGRRMKDRRTSKITEAFVSHARHDLQDEGYSDWRPPSGCLWHDHLDLARPLRWRLRRILRRSDLSDYLVATLWYPMPHMHMVLARVLGLRIVWLVAGWYCYI